MSDYERTFPVSVPVERAWRAFTDPSELETWFAHRFDAETPDGPAEASTAGEMVGFEVTQIKDGELLSYRQWRADPSVGIDVTVVFEPVDGGTRITMTHAGFGGDSILNTDMVHRGMDETLADLVLYLDHGIVFPRHRDLVVRGSLGLVRALDTAAGVEVLEMWPNSCLAGLGLQAGDLLLQLGRGPVFDIGDVNFFQRDHAEGEEVEVVWAHNGGVCHGRATLGAHEANLFERVP
jgi:uncharacterized protein YndB with AHSA1/START domain